ncbi:hypothetical protein ACLESD_48445 [Pyxidicoccus sp. 3LFB2]
MATQKGRRALEAGALTLGLALSGCGDLMGSEAEDEALLTVEGTLLATTPLDEAQKKQLRAALHWEHWPQATLECMLENSFTVAMTRCQRLSPRQAFERRSVDVKVTGRFPGTFRMPVSRLPDPGVLHGDAGSRLGVAYVLAYVDGNDNGQLDSVSTTATSSPDSIVGHQEGYKNGDTEFHWVVYREGTLHPLYEKLFDGCPTPPEGYSLLTYRYRNDSSLPEGHQYFEGCFVQGGRVQVNISIEPNAGVQQMACEQPNTLVLSELVRATTAGPPPAGSTQHCTPYRSVSRDEVLLVNRYPERFCSVANTQVYSLRDYWNTAWDDRASPPAWWPCAVTP